MNARRRAVGSALVGVVLALLVAACGSGGGDPSAAGPVPGASATDGAATGAQASGPLSSATASGSAAPSGPSASDVTAASSGTHTSASAAASSHAPAAEPGGPPPLGVKWDYQIGGAYAPPAGVGIVSRDRSSAPAKGLYNICYINAFQAQTDAVPWWQQHDPDLLLRGADGSPVVDQDWNEPLLDVSTAAKRSRLAAVENTWIDGCAHSGYQAVEADNLDSYSRSGGLLTLDDDAAFATLLARRAHADGLAIGQKNTTELLSRAPAIGFDFAVAEQCGKYGECGQYAGTFAGHVVDVEYDDKGFGAACQGWGKKIAVVRRDQDVNAAGHSGYVYKSC